MRRLLVALFILVVCLPLILTVFSVSRLVTDRVLRLLADQADSRLEVARNLIQHRWEEIALKARMLAQLSEIREPILARREIVLIDRLNVLRRDLRLDRLGAVIEVYDASGSLLVVEPRVPLRLLTPAQVRQALRGNVLHDRDYLGEQLAFRAAVPLYHDASAEPVGVIGVGFFGNESFLEEIKAICNTEVVLMGNRRGVQTMLGTTVVEGGRRTFPFIAHLPDRPFDVHVGGNSYVVRGTTFTVPSGDFAVAVAVRTTPIQALLTSVRRALARIGGVAGVFADRSGVVPVADRSLAEAGGWRARAWGGTMGGLHAGLLGGGRISRVGRYL